MIRQARERQQSWVSRRRHSSAVGLASLISARDPLLTCLTTSEPRLQAYFLDSEPLANADVRAPGQMCSPDGTHVEGDATSKWAQQHYNTQSGQHNQAEHNRADNIEKKRKKEGCRHPGPDSSHPAAQASPRAPHRLSTSPSQGQPCRKRPRAGPSSRGTADSPEPCYTPGGGGPHTLHDGNGTWSRPAKERRNQGQPGQDRRRE